MIALRRIEERDAAFIFENWTGDAPLPGYSFPAEKAEISGLIREWLCSVHQGAHFEMLVIERDGWPVGLLSLYQKEGDVSLGISLHPVHQRQGVGTQAVHLAAERAREAGWENIISECRLDNAASIALHKKCGFERMGTRMNRKGNRVFCWKMPLNTKEKE